MKLAEKDTKLPATERQALARNYADRARAMLVEAVKRGAPTINGALEAETLPIVDSKACWLMPQNMEGWGWRDWSNGYQLYYLAEKDGYVTLEIDVARQGRYHLDIYLTQSPGFGKIDVALDGNKVGKTFDAYALRVMPTGPVPFGVVALSQGKHQLRFTAVDKHPKSLNYGFGIDCLKLRPIE